MPRGQYGVVTLVLLFLQIVNNRLDFATITRARGKAARQGRVGIGILAIEVAITEQDRIALGELAAQLFAGKEGQGKIVRQFTATL